MTSSLDVLILTKNSANSLEVKRSSLNEVRAPHTWLFFLLKSQNRSSLSFSFIKSVENYKAINEKQFAHWENEGALREVYVASRSAPNRPINLSLSSGDANKLKLAN